MRQLRKKDNMKHLLILLLAELQTLISKYEAFLLIANGDHTSVIDQDEIYKIVGLHENANADEYESVCMLTELIINILDQAE